jgi:hypothetical protein
MRSAERGPTPGSLFKAEISELMESGNIIKSLKYRIVEPKIVER